MRRQLASFTLILGLFIGFLGSIVLLGGCGEDQNLTDTTDETQGPTSVNRTGIEGDTYRNLEYLFKIAHLPQEGWVIREVTNLTSNELLKAWKAAFDPGTKFNKTEDLLLLEPTEDADFQDTLVGAMTAGIPYIFVQIEEQTVTSYLNPQQVVDGVLTQLPQVYAPETFEIQNKGDLYTRDRMPGFYYEIDWLEPENPPENPEEGIVRTGKNKEVFFMRANSPNFIYHLSYWAPDDQYETYLPVFDELLEYLELNAG